MTSQISTESRRRSEDLIVGDTHNDHSPASEREPVGFKGIASTQEACIQACSLENRLLIVLALGGAVSAVDAQSLFYLSPFVASALSLSNAEIGLVSSVVLLSWSVTGYLVGTLSDRSGRRKPLLVMTFLLFAVCSIFSGLASSFALLLCARTLIGLAEGPVIPISQSIMLRYSSPHRRGLNMGIVQNLGAQLIGTFLAPIILVRVSMSLGWHSAFYIAGFPALLVAALVAWVVPGDSAGAVAPIPPTAAAGSGLLGLLRVRNVQLCVVIACCVIAWYFLLLSFLPLYCVRVLRISPTSMSYLMSAVGAAGVVSAFLVPALSDRVGRKRVMALFVLASIAAPLAPMYLGGSLTAVAALVFIGSLALGTIPLFMAIVPSESLPTRDAASATGLVMGLGQIIGGFCGPWVGGVLADHWSLAVPLWTAAGAGLLGALTCLHLTETAPRLAHSDPRG